MKWKIALFCAGLVILGAGLYLFEFYSPLAGSGLKIVWQFALGIAFMCIGLGLYMAGAIMWLCQMIVNKLGK